MFLHFLLSVFNYSTIMWVYLELEHCSCRLAIAQLFKTLHKLIVACDELSLENIVFPDGKKQEVNVRMLKIIKKKVRSFLY